MNSSSKTGEAGKPDDKGPVVEVTNLNTNDTVKFHVDWDKTLQHVWDKAYEELKETKHPEDQLLCEGGGSLMGHLSETLAELRDKKICVNRKYQIRRPTGGA